MNKSNNLDNLEIREPRELIEYEAIEEIQIDAWGMSERDIVPSRIAIAIHEAGGCLFIAYLNGEPVGYVLGFLAGSKEFIYLHSHQVGVKRKFWGRGIGYLLKLKQREWALERGIDLIRWTFDPLLARNAYFNFSKLGVINNTYKINLYGEMRDEINKGMESDRFYVEWWLSSQRVIDRINNIKPPKSLSIEHLPKTIEVVKEKGVLLPSSVKLGLDNKVVLVPIPRDIDGIKKKDIKLAMEWRLATRKVFSHYFSRGYIAIDFIMDKKNELAYYVLIGEEKSYVLKSRWWNEL